MVRAIPAELVMRPAPGVQLPGVIVGTGLCPAAVVPKVQEASSCLCPRAAGG